MDCRPGSCQAPLSMEFSRPEYWRGFPSPGDLPNPGIKPRSSALKADSLPAKPQGKPKNTRVGSLSLLQQIFLTQGLNQGLLHCRQILTNWAIREALFDTLEYQFLATWDPITRKVTTASFLTHLIVILVLLRWSGTESALSSSYTYMWDSSYLGLFF